MAELFKLQAIFKFHQSGTTDDRVHDELEQRMPEDYAKKVCGPSYREERVERFICVFILGYIAGIMIRIQRNFEIFRDWVMTLENLQGERSYTKNSSTLNDKRSSWLYLLAYCHT